MLYCTALPHPILVTEGGLIDMILTEILLAVMVNVACHYIFKWLDSKDER